MRSLGLSTLAVLSLAGAASAQTMDLSFLGTSAGSSVTVTAPGHNGGTFAGQIRFNFANPQGGTPSSFVGNQISFCIELPQGVSSSARTYNYVPTTSPAFVTGNSTTDARRAAVAWLFERHGNQATSGNNTVAAAMQLAIWEVMNDWNPATGRASLDLSSGNLTSTVSGATLTQANAFLDDAIPGIGLPTGVAIWTNNNVQDQITVVPTPGAGVIAAFALAGMVGRRRRPAL